MLELLDATQFIASEAKPHWAHLHESLLSHEYYKDNRGLELRNRLETKFGFVAP
jgi:hypothetical protein